MKFNRSVGAFEFPHTATALLLAVNILVYALTLQRSGMPTPSPDALMRSGAIYSGALARHEYWRLVAYAFLHASMLHIVGNMACLVWWGGPLEKRIGTAYFLLIYFASVIAGASPESSPIRASTSASARRPAPQAFSARCYA